MKHEIIKTENYLLVLSDEKIMPCKNIGRCMSHITKPCEKCGKYQGRGVLSHLPLNGAPYLEGVDVLPEIEDEVEKVSIAEAEKLHDKDKHDDWDIYHQLIDEDARLIKLGFNKAKETYKYTDKDIMRALHVGFCSYPIKMEMKIDNNKNFEKWSKEYIQFLNQQKLPIAFDTRNVKDCQSNCGNEDNCKYCTDTGIPKTITNSNGQTEWVGTYIFEK